MPLNAARLQLLIVAESSKNIKKKFKGAQPGANMKKFAKGIATGMVLTITGKTGQIIPPIGIGGVGLGILGIQAPMLSDEIVKNCRSAFGAEGPALRSISDAVAKAVVAELKLASVLGTNGGTAMKFSGWGAQQMATAMFKATGFKKTSQNTKIFLAFAKAITSQIQKNGKSVIPTTGPGSGPGIAVIG